MSRAFSASNKNTISGLMSLDGTEIMFNRLHVPHYKDSLCFIHKVAISTSSGSMNGSFTALPSLKDFLFGKHGKM